MIYNIAFLSLDNVFWKGLYKVTKLLDSSDATTKGIDKALTIAQEKKAAAGKILKVPVKLTIKQKKLLGQ